MVGTPRMKVKRLKCCRNRWVSEKKKKKRGGRRWFRPDRGPAFHLDRYHCELRVESVSWLILPQNTKQISSKCIYSAL